MLKNTDLFYKNSTISFLLYYTLALLLVIHGEGWEREGICDTWICEIPFAGKGRRTCQLDSHLHLT